MRSPKKKKKEKKKQRSLGRRTISAFWASPKVVVAGVGLFLFVPSFSSIGVEIPLGTFGFFFSILVFYFV
jgi:paraquat-inducible protein B